MKPQPMRQFVLMMLAGWLACGLLGCQPKPPPIGYYVSDAYDFHAVKSVAFIGLHANDTLVHQGSDVSVAIFQAIQARKLFKLDLIPADDDLCKNLPLDNRGAFTIEQLDSMRKTLGTDAVLFGKIENCKPYPQMQLGLTLRLLDLKNGKLLWGVDHTWDTADQTLEHRIQSYYYGELRSGYGPVEWRLALVSPKAFFRFVAFETAETLPTQEVTEQAKADHQRKVARNAWRIFKETTDKL